jgi:type IX secretion system PorP/SprF family membrane protein
MLNSSTYSPCNASLRHFVLFGLLLTILFPDKAVSQSPQFSQFYASPIFLAPSFAGATDGSRLVMNYRNQWPDLPNAFVTYAFSLDHYFHNYRSGAGILLFRDEAGSGRLASTKSALAYSYNFNINRLWTVRPGLSFIYEQRTVDFSRFILGDQIDNQGNIAPTSIQALEIEQIGYFDATSSIILYSPNIWTGLTVDHLMKPNQSITSAGESRIPMKISLFGGYRFDFGGRYAQQSRESVSLALMYRNQWKFNQIDFGAYWTKDPVFLGLMYRGIPIFNNTVHGIYNNDAIVFSGGLRMDNARVGYSYDFTISRLINNTGGAHEISLIYQFNQGPPQRRQGKIPCPEGQM